ncbi:hypothetical protein VKS41_003625 [Umbelopsis sp. WA50703]
MSSLRRIIIFPAFACVCLLGYLVIWINTSAPPYEALDQHISNNKPIIDSSVEETSSEEKYLAFFTHSGLQNQLNEVENAILLAWFLNRTLLMPRALFGQPFGWMPFDRLLLEHQLRDDSDSQVQMCLAHDEELDLLENDCPDPNQYTMLAFDDIFDLEWAKQHVRIVNRENMTYQWLEEKFDIHRAGELSLPNGSYVDGDILYFKDETRYHWRIYDEVQEGDRKGKYAEILDVQEIRHSPQKLIHLGSVFGSGKILIRRPEHLEFWRKLQRSIIYRHPIVTEVAENFLASLNGAGSFIGVHVRSGDGFFIKALPRNMQKIMWQIKTAIAKHSDIPSLQEQLAIIPKHPNLAQCLELAKSHNISVVYLATDAREPSTNPDLAILYATFPCTFTIDNFTDPANQPGWNALNNAANAHDGRNMKKYLIPMVDATIASRGRLFVGTESSTFSGYISRLHDVFWTHQQAASLIGYRN